MIEEKYVRNALTVCGLDEEIIENMLIVYRRYMVHETVLEDIGEVCCNCGKPI
jgi:hypothetical protein